MKSYYEYSANKAENVTDMIKRNSGSDFTLVAFSIKNIGKINKLFGPTEGDKAVYFTAQELKRTPFWSKYVYAQIYSNCYEYFSRTFNGNSIYRQDIRAYEQVPDKKRPDCFGNSRAGNYKPHRYNEYDNE